MTAKSDKCTQKPHRKVFSKCTENHHHLRAFPSLLAPASSSCSCSCILKLGLFLLSVSCLGLLCALFCCRNLKLTRHLPDKQIDGPTDGQTGGMGGRLTERLMCNNYPKLICLFAPARQSVKVELANRPTHWPFTQSWPTFSSPSSYSAANECYYGRRPWSVVVWQVSS